MEANVIRAQLADHCAMRAGTQSGASRQDIMEIKARDQECVAAVERHGEKIGDSAGKQSQLRQDFERQATALSQGLEKLAQGLEHGRRRLEMLEATIPRLNGDLADLHDDMSHERARGSIADRTRSEERGCCRACDW